MFVCSIDPECKLIISFSIIVLLIVVIFDSHEAGCSLGPPESLVSKVTVLY